MNLTDTARHLPLLLGAVFFAVLFIQSGLDKVFDWKGNLAWLTGHFSKTFLAGMVPMLLATITAAEVTTGLLSAAGVVYYFVIGSTSVIFYAAVIGAASLTALFFGQRMAKDYAGAAVLVPYFLLALALIYLADPYIKT